MPKKIIYCPDRYYHRDLCCYAQMNKTLIRRRFFVLWIQKYKRPLQTFVDMFIDYTLLFFEAWIKKSYTKSRSFDQFLTWYFICCCYIRITIYERQIHVQRRYFKCTITIAKMCFFFFIISKLSSIKHDVFHFLYKK